MYRRGSNIKVAIDIITTLTKSETSQPIVSRLQHTWKANIFLDAAKRHFQAKLFNHFTDRRQISLRNIMKVKRIGTHDGVFHCDEVLACYMLKQLPEYKDADIIRTRKQKELDKCDIVVDVGAEFDHAKKRYDHHQREFNETLSSLHPDVGDKYKIKLSSAGLIYAYYGEKVIETIAPKEAPVSPANMQLIYRKVYENFLEEIDALDNGIPITDGELRYKIKTHLGARVGRLNPEWNSKGIIDINEIFNKAMKLVGEEFHYTVNYFISVWLPARDFVRDSVNRRYEIHSSGQIIQFTERFPWKEHLFDVESEMGLAGEIQYVIFSDRRNSWRVQAVPVLPTSFVTRKPLNKKWWGVRDELLSDVSGIANCVFCHSNGFIGGNTTRKGVLAMAVASLEAVDDPNDAVADKKETKP